MLYKKGVSLITVLMFMLVATIAATATFKLLTSENKSSASRMEIQEASQSAAAGIRSVRAWMTNNANEVGAVVRQYILGGKQPISLNSRVNALSNGKQNYNVWLAGISENNGAYKFKIISEGLARQDSRYTETAILNVSGLYQVDPPVEPPKKRHLDFDYSYFGSTVRNDGDMQVSSMIINGDWHGNPNTVDRNIVITGKARLSGNEINILGTGCIGGDLYADNGIEAKNLYVHGTSHKFGTKNEDSKLGISRHAYFDGNVEHHDGKKIYVGGNLTVKGLFKTHMGSGGSSVTINGNLCVDSTTSQIQLGEMSGGSFNEPFTVRNNVYAMHSRAFYASNGDFSGNYAKLILGNTSDSKVYIPDAYHSSEYDNLRANYPKFVDVSSDANKYYFYVTPALLGPLSTGDSYQHLYYDGQKKKSPYCDGSQCHVTPWFFSTVSNENFFQRVPSEPYDFVRDVDCADSVKQVCDAIWTKKKGCDNAEYKVDDILVTAYKKFNSYADSGCAKEITSLDSANFVPKMNDCYNKSKNNPDRRDKDLYNGYLVVKVTAEQKNDFEDANKNVQTLKGKFIIIITNKPSNGELNLPPTDPTGNNYVMLYLTQGTGSYVTLKGIDNQRYNYFIYTKSNVGASIVTPTYDGPEINKTGGFLFNHAELHGTIYAAAETCAKIASINNARPIVFNQALLDDLSQNQVICPTGEDGFTEDNCGGPANSSSSSSASSPTSSASGDELIGGKDPYFVSIAPQLNVTLESQYKSTESTPTEVNETNDVGGSIIVMPRIVYLSKTPKGKLTDYISVLTLNVANKSAREDKTKGTITNCDAIPTSGKLSAGGELTSGRYKCMYNPQKSYNPVPFYVVVSDEVGELPAVNFKETSSETIRSNETTLVKVRIDGTTGTDPIKFHYSIDEAVLGYPGWIISTASTDLAGVKVTQRDSSSGHRLYFTVEVSPNAEAQDVPILKLTTEADPTYGDLYIDLIPPTENCLIGTITEHHIMVRGRANINRASLSDYCSLGGDVDCGTVTWGYTTLAELNSRRDCNYSDEWVTAQCRSSKVVVANESWTCLTDDPITLVKVNENAIPSECEPAIIPTGGSNRIENALGGNTYNLYASLKWRKIKLTFKVKNASELSGSVAVETSTGTVLCEESELKSTDGCQGYIYAATPIPLVINADGDFKKYFRGWLCSPDSAVNNCSSSSPLENHGIQYNGFYGPHTITLDFSPESHCYYDDFDDEYTEFKSTTTAFCPPDVTTCVDTCNVAPSNSGACMPKYGKQLESNWLMTYHNKGSGDNATYVAPVIDLDKGYIYASPSQDKPSILLRNKGVGHNGTLFSLVQTGIVSQKDTKDFLNSGLIFRSNGNKHLVLNIYGANKENNSAELKFRVCKVEGQSISSATNCRAVAAKENVNPITITNSTFIKVKLVVDNNSLKVTGKVDETTWEGELDIAAFETNDATYTYVGLSLADPDFRVYDNGWTSSALDDACPAWEVPSVTCHFDDKVPLQETVTPFVSLATTWFEDRNCVKKYYYNGCDNRTSDQVSCGRPGEIGSELYNDVGEYFFEQEGKHGVLNSENKRTKAAFVKMVCPGNVSSLDLAQDYDCGEFTVGDPSYCLKDVEIIKENHYNILTGQNVFSIDDEKDQNMLGAEIRVHIRKNVGLLHQQQDLGANLTIQLEDANGVRSLSRFFSSTTDVEKITNEMISANNLDFDLQHVTKVIITSDADITVDELRIHSDCSNKLDLKCEKAELKLNSNEWVIKVKPQPHEVTCSYSSDDSNIRSENDVSCNDHPMTYEDGHEFDWAFKNDSTTFTVTARKKSPAGKILAETSCTIKGKRDADTSLDCGIGREDEHTKSKTISYGSMAPNFWFKFGSNIAGAKSVPYTVTLPSELSETSREEGRASMGTTQNIQTLSSTIPSAGGPYTYNVVIEAGDNPSCEAIFRVSTTNTTCSVDDQGKFTANIGNPDNTTFSYMIVVANPIANPLKNETGFSSEASLPLTLEYSPRVDGKYYYLVYVNDRLVCKDSLDYKSNFSLTCPASITGQDPGSSIVANVEAILNGENCGDKCTYKVEGRPTTTEWANGQMKVLFEDVEALGQGKKYTLKVNTGTGLGAKTQTCEFTVDFIPLSITKCPANKTDQDPSSPITVGEYSAKPCGTGCTYKIFDESNNEKSFDGSSFKDPNGADTKTYKFEAKNSGGETKSCTFDVSFKNTPIGVTCSDITGQNPSSPINVNASVTGCGITGTECTYQVGSNASSESLPYSFNDPSGTGSQSYTLKVTHKTNGEIGSCTFKVTFKNAESKCIPFVNGVFGYTEHCYSSGLENQPEGKCYALQDGRAQDQNAAAIQWINNNASDTYWWKEVSCY